MSCFRAELIEQGSEGSAHLRDHIKPRVDTNNAEALLYGQTDVGLMTMVEPQRKHSKCVLQCVVFGKSNRLEKG